MGWPTSWLHLGWRTERSSTLTPPTSNGAAADADTSRTKRLRRGRVAFTPTETPRHRPKQPVGAFKEEGGVCQSQGTPSGGLPHTGATASQPQAAVARPGTLLGWLSRPQPTDKPKAPTTASGAAAAGSTSGVGTLSSRAPRVGKLTGTGTEALNLLKQAATARIEGRATDADRLAQLALKKCPSGKSLFLVMDAVHGPRFDRSMMLR